MTRERLIVTMAAQKVSGYTRKWLRMDERGVFELYAKDMLRDTAGKAQSMGIAEDQVNAQIATLIALSATEAQLHKAAAQ